MGNYDTQMGGPETVEHALSEAATPRKDEFVGTLLDNRYFIKQKLGHGGFGAVYLASDEKMLSRKVVVKVMHDEETKDEWSVRKFQQEIEALARVDHPSIVGVLDAGDMPDGKPYIVMQYVDGVSLRTGIRPEGMDFSRAAGIIKQIGRALNAAHERGILHRDLKPENVMLQALGEGEEQVKIIDFGVAKVKDSVVSLSTGKNRTVGTIAYMSPEQLSAEPLTAASDIYAFAVISYEMLTGRRPANPESAYQLLEMQRSGVRIKPTDLRPGMPEAAQKIVLSSLAFDPKQRCQRARDFGDQLAAALVGDDEQTLVRSAVEGGGAGADTYAETLPLETAYVLFTDIVSYSKLPLDQQPARLRQLQEIVRKTNECGRAKACNQLISLPTGDGMALVFFGEPEAPVKCALEISRALKGQPEIDLRMGVNSGLVYRMADINTNMNVAGGGINLAQRVMDCGDAGHILISKRVADDLGQITRWRTYLHDLGEAEVKHGVLVHIYNLYGEDVGNPEVPSKLRAHAAKPAFWSTGKITAALLLFALIVGGVWYGVRTRSGRQPPIVSPGPVVTAGPEQSLAYWLTVQEVKNGKPQGKVIESSGQEIYGNGWKFQFNVSPTQQGALYLLNEGPGPTGATEYDVLFPTPGNNQGIAQVGANQTVQTGWNYFVEHEGLEKLWIIWSAQPVPELDAIFKDAASHQGVVDAAQVAPLQTYLKKYESAAPEIKSDKSKNRTFMKGRGDILVQLIQLSHRAY